MKLDQLPRQGTHAAFHLGATPREHTLPLLNLDKRVRRSLRLLLCLPEADGAAHLQHGTRQLLDLPLVLPRQRLHCREPLDGGLYRGYGRVVGGALGTRLVGKFLRLRVPSAAPAARAVADEDQGVRRAPGLRMRQAAVHRGLRASQLNELGVTTLQHRLLLGPRGSFLFQLGPQARQLPECLWPA